MTGLHQTRSKHALSAVHRIQALEATHQGLLGTGRSLLENLSALIAINGPIPTLLNYETERKKKRKDGDQESQVWGGIIDAMEDHIKKMIPPKTAGTLSIRLSNVIAAGEYILIEEELMEFSAWLKRWGQALLEKSPQTQGGSRAGTTHE